MYTIYRILAGSQSRQDQSPGRRLAEETGVDAFELQRRMRHLSKKYLRLSIVPTTEAAARFVETR